MNCRWCGAEYAEGEAVCPSCRQPQNIPPPPYPTDPLDRIVAEAKRNARELADASEKLSVKLAHEARRAADDPSNAAYRAVKRFQKEIKDAKRDLERALRALE